MMDYTQSLGGDTTATQGFYDYDRIPETPRPPSNKIVPQITEKSGFRNKIGYMSIGLLLGIAMTIVLTHVTKHPVLKTHWESFNTSMISQEEPEDIESLITKAKEADDDDEYEVNTDIGWVNIEPLYKKVQLPELLIKQYIKIMLKANRAKRDIKKEHEKYPKEIEKKEETDEMGRPKKKKIKDETYEDRLHKKLMNKGRQKLTDLEALELRVKEKWSGEIKFYPLYNTKTNRWSLGIAEFDKDLRNVVLRVFTTTGRRNVDREIELLSRAYKQEVNKDVQKLQEEFLELPSEGKKGDIINKLNGLKPITNPLGISEEESVDVSPNQSGVYVCLMAREFIAGKPFAVREDLIGKERLIIAGDILENSAPDDMVEMFVLNNIKYFK